MVRPDHVAHQVTVSLRAMSSTLAGSLQSHGRGSSLTTDLLVHHYSLTFLVLHRLVLVSLASLAALGFQLAVTFVTSDGRTDGRTTSSPRRIFFLILDF